MSGASVFVLAIGTGLAILGFWMARTGVRKRRIAMNLLENACLHYWERVQARERAANAAGEVLLGCFAMAMGLGLDALALSGLLVY